MHRTVEGEAWKAPEGYSSLAHSWRFDDVIRPAHFNDLPQLARELGFAKVTKLPTKRSGWQVFARPEYDVPNFPEGATRVSSSLGIYGTGEELTRAILRTSPEPHPVREFEKDLASLTKHYIERPRLLGFPSVELTRIGHVFTALAVGVIGGDAAGYYMGGDIVNLGAVLGEMGGPAVYGVAWGLAERHARRSISHREQYTAGESVKWTLEGERYHNVKVAIQKELYQALQQEGASLSPDQFLDKIYGQIPEALIERRHAEVEQVKYPKTDPPRKIGNSFPELIKVSHALQQAESYLQMASKLKNGLANP